MSPYFVNLINFQQETVSGISLTVKLGLFNSQCIQKSQLQYYCF